MIVRLKTRTSATSSRAILESERIDWVVPRLNARAARPDTGVTRPHRSRNFTFRDWDAEQRGDFDELCGQLMSQLSASNQLEAHDVVPTPLEESASNLPAWTLQAEQRMLAADDSR